MRRLLLLLATLAIAVLALASQAIANTTVSLKMTFIEPTHQNINSGCPVLPNGGCGNGAVTPFGHATETIVGGGACGGSCDFRTVNIAGGSIYMDESLSNPTCPGSCQPNPAEPFTGTLTDVVVGGTGIFAGATGTLSGSVSANGPEAVIQLSGTIHYDP
jgi:hypothetical protein